MKDKNIVQLINQLIDIQQKIDLEKKFERNFKRIFSILEDEGFICRYPLGEKHHATRTDYEATIIGDVFDDMYISQVIKPIIYKKNDDTITLIQKGVVIVEA